MLQGLKNLDVNPQHEKFNLQSAPTANSVTNTNIQLKMLKILQELQSEYSGRRGRGVGGSRSGRGNHNQNKIKRNPDNITFNCRIENLYYHTHRRCNHILLECTRKAAGHKDKAKLINCLGGFNDFCQPVDGAVE